MLELHDKYGPIVRIGPNHVAVDGSIAWPEIFDHRNAKRPEFGRIPEWWDPIGEGLHDIFIANREDHRRQRKLLAHAFSQTAMYEQEPLIKSYVDLFISRLRDRAAAKEPIDANSWFNYTTFDIIGDLAFADPFNCLKNSNMHPWVSIIFDGVKAGGLLRFCLQYPLLAKPVHLFYGKTVMQKRAEHKMLAREKTKRRIALGPAGEDRKDFMTYMLRHNDEKGMTESELINNSDALIVAGSETTATALTGLTYLLSTNPAVMKRLTNEIRSTFATEDEITMKSTLPLPYLNATIEEGLRCHPPVPESPPRQSPGEYVHGRYLPKGVKTTTFQWATYHSNRNFVEPFAFKPERWLPSTHEWYDRAFEHDNKAAFNPFSAGPRNCIGKNLAYSELRIILSRFLWNFDISLVEGFENWEEQQRSFLLWEKTPLMIRLGLVDRPNGEVLEEKH